MEKKYFGTDGIRGVVGKTPITAEFVLKLGQAAGHVLATTQDKPIFIGKDTRLSGDMLESALTTGLVSAGVNVGILGVLPTPAIAYLTQKLQACAGIVISASHNPYTDNGIKFFNDSGQKLSDTLELEVEKHIASTFPSVLAIGKSYLVNEARDLYQQYCCDSVGGARLDNMKIVLDCAQGATYQVAPLIFTALGADVVVIGAQPTGININEACGSTSPQLLQETVLREKADVGIAFDGDGDRVIMVDNRGEIVNGDQLLYVLATHGEKSQWRSGVVGTLMSNLAFEEALLAQNILFARANVGDRYVQAMLREKGWHLGGEPSGHIICNDSFMGDGIIAALQILKVLVTKNKSLYELHHTLSLYPQVLINVHLATKPKDLSHPTITQAVKEAEKSLGRHGRVLLRTSGTESVARVMVEGENKTQVQALANFLASEVKNVLGNNPAIQ